MREEPNAIKRRTAMKTRINYKARRLSPDAAADLLQSFGGVNGPGSTPTLRAWLGCWSQSLDSELRAALGRRLRKRNR
tara:strand:- start:372 stop:605 length:234 start_codon:yes stop_codon:yes gene_type:complete